ncbi:MAG: hypothetical protein ABIH67_05045 [Candidatus Uhrbacteria bacterium]
MRISKNQELEEVKQELKKTKKQLSSEIKRETKKGHPILTCFLVIIVLVLILISWFCSIVAQTGLVTIPVFTNFFYNQPEPTRQVLATVPIEEFLSTEIGSTINQRLQPGSLDFDRTFSISLTEGSLTASVQSLLDQAGFFEHDGARVVVSEDVGLEVFLPVAENPLRTAMTAELTPFINDQGVIDVEINRLKIGSLSLPIWLVRLVLAKPLDLVIWELNKNFVSYVDLSGVLLTEGSVIFDGNITVDLFEL